MRSLIEAIFLLAVALHVSAAEARFVTGFSVLADDAGSWPLILSSVGFLPQPAAQAGIFVLRPGATASPGWVERVEQGAILIVEGESAPRNYLAFGPRRIAWW
jgi:hypothetical protein